MKNIKRIVVFLGAALLAGTVVAGLKKPNVLFVMCDDHATTAVGSYGGRLASLNPTPNLDRLACKGMLFENVYCENSICTPSRAAIITGQYSHRNGAHDLYNTLPGEKHHLSREFKQAGYTTAVVGKWHLSDSPTNFDYFAVLPGQGSYNNPILHVSMGGEMKTVRYCSILTRTIPVVKKTGHSSDVLTDVSLDWLENIRDKEKPFMLMHHFKAPHNNFTYATRYASYLADTEIPEPENLYDQPGLDFGSIATRGIDDSLVGIVGSSMSERCIYSAAKRNRKQIDKMSGKETLTDNEITHYAYQLYLKKYLRCVKGIDDNLQRLLDYLEANDLLENTIIVYTSDQGMILGEHDYIDKRWMYEESIHMPLVVHYPPIVKAGERNDWLVNNTDFAPTLLALAGIKKPDYMQGHSLLGALKGEPEPKDWRKATYYRYWMHWAHHRVPAHFGVRTKKHKLVFFYGTDFTDTHNGRKVTQYDGNRFGKDTPAGWEFYDLERDPRENHNRYGNPEYAQIISALKQELWRQREELGDTDESYPKIREIIDENSEG